MEIIRASVLGFCFGVRRAVDLAEKALCENKGKKVYSLGPLIHNESALAELNKKGLEIIEEDDVESIPSDSVVILRAHGVAPVIINILEQKKCKIIDATCPRVKASQKMVEKYTYDDDFVIISGDKNHGEMKGIAGYASKNFLQIQNAEDAAKLGFSLLEGKSVILMSQTTYSEAEFSKIEQIIRKKVKNLAVMNTICPATRERQEALVELCQKVEGVLIVGGKNSANTKRLYQTAQKYCQKAAHIQNAEEIPEEFFTLEKVGITAGASTPDAIIDGVEESLGR
ncbi:MAG: 4-hydroxy-3-methylbut-2-enyl diphosphate reductase [Treponema sp.]|nr:4-hydroxy-3-methylbut-2-enyl diphosphate reductase [Treponema sp.]